MITDTANPRGAPHVITKMCTACGQLKPVTEFYRHSNGLRSACKDCTRSRSRNYYQANRERELARSAEYSSSFPHRKWIRNYRARSRHYGLEPVVEPFNRDELIERHGDRCVYCGGPFECTDHVIAVAAGGLHTLGNVVPCCESCNRAKLHSIDLRLIRLIRTGIELREAYERVAA